MTMWDDEWKDTSKLNTYGLCPDEKLLGGYNFPVLYGEQQTAFNLDMRTSLL